MTLLLSFEQYEQLWQPSWDQETPADPGDSQDLLMPYPKVLATGYKRNITLRNGIHLTLHDYRIRQGFQAPKMPAPGSLEFVFNVSSRFERGDGIPIAPGQHYLSGMAARCGWREQDDEHKLAVDVHLSPEIMGSLWGESLELLSKDWQKMLLGQSDQSFSPVQPTPSAMQIVLQQIMSCPFQGSTKQLYLESKVMELLALQLHELIDKPSKNRVKPRQLEALYQAKTILSQRLSDPPSLLELARSVGLNDCTLKAGFRQTFGTTVFGYVHQQRMEQARQLLLSSRSRVTDVAATVGYASPTAFTAAFRKQFGCNPKQYQTCYGLK